MLILITDLMIKSIIGALFWSFISHEWKEVKEGITLPTLQLTNYDIL
jgi:hypothetical protein